MPVDSNFIVGPGPVSAAAVIIAGAPAGGMRITGLAGAAASMVGKHQLVQRSTHPGNNGYFLIAAVVDPATIDVVNGAAVIPDRGPLWTVFVDGRSNTWQVKPADDATDSSNFQFAGDLAQGITANAGKRAHLKAGSSSGPQVFFFADEIDWVDVQMDVTPFSNAGCTFRGGKQNGDPMNPVSVANAATFQNQTRYPSMFKTFQRLGGIGTDLMFRNNGNGRIKFDTVPSSNFNAGTQGRWENAGQEGPAPWDNMNLFAFIYTRGYIGVLKTGFVNSISAPDRGGDQTVETCNATWVAADVGKVFTNFDSPDAGNNVQVMVKTVIDATHITIHNPGGVANANPNNRYSAMPDPLPVSKRNLTVTGCDFEAALGDPIPAYSGDSVSSIAVAIKADDQEILHGASPAPPVNSVRPDFESRFSEYNGVTTWGGRKARDRQLINGNVTIKDATFLRCGFSAIFAGAAYTDMGYRLTFPPGASPPIADFGKMTATDCGYNANVSGSGPGLAVFGDFQGSASLKDSNFHNSIGTRDPDNSLIAVYVEEPFANFAEPQGKSLFPAGEFVFTRHQPSFFLRNLTSIYEDVWGSFPNGHIGLFGGLNDAGDPRVFWCSCVIRDCNFRGQGVFQPVDIEDMGNLVLENSTIEGDSESAAVWLNGSNTGEGNRNVTVRNITFIQEPDTRAVPPIFNINVLGGNVQCRIIDGLRQVPTVLDLGLNTVCRGCEVNTDPANAPM